MREMVVGQRHTGALIRSMEKAAGKGKRYCRIKETRVEMRRRGARW